MKTKNNLYQKKFNAAFVGFACALLAIPIFFSANCYAVKTYILGNYVIHGNSSKNSGPTGDGTLNISYSSKPTVIFSRSSTLAPANVVLNWDGSHGSSSGKDDGFYCTQYESGTGNGFSIETSFISAGNYGGVDIFKTNIQGLYFSLNIRSFSAYNQASFKPSNVDIKSGIMHNVLSISPLATGCNQTNTTGTVDYATFGGMAFYSKITFYTDQTYTPGPSSVSLLKNADYDIRIWNENPGAGINSYYLNVNYDISSVVISEPTCSTQPVASGNGVSGTTVNLGSYSPNDIINGMTPVPFAIKLAGCKGLRNINVTLSTPTVAGNPALLGNILTSSNATGVGLEISGAANNYSPQTVMFPNDTTSVYNDQRDTSKDNNIYGSGESGTTQSQTLNFLATLKRDGTQQIGSGNFKANGTFTIDYP